VKLAELIAAKEQELRTAQDSYDRALARQQGIVTTVREERRQNLSQAEQVEFDGLEGDKQRADARSREARKRLEELQAVAVEETAVEERQATVTQTAAGVPAQRTGVETRSYEDVARVVSEPRTYTRETSRDGVSFFRDAYRATFHSDPHAAARQARHSNEAKVESELQQRAMATTSFAGLVVPQYLVDEAALLLRAGRPLANVLRRMELPAQGDTFQVPRGTTGASATIQATQNSATSLTDEVWANVTVPVVTVAGQQQVSRQSIDRGTPGLDGLIYADLVGAYAATLDTQVINGTGSSGQMLGILNTSGIYTATAFAAGVTAANFTSKLAGGVQAIAGAGTVITPRIIVMHPRRWGWLQSLSDSAGRPLAVALPVGPYNAGALIQIPGGYGADGDPKATGGANFVGMLANGLPVVTDANIPVNVGTNAEDVVLVLDNHAHILWEDGDGMPKQFRFDQTLGTQLTVALVVAGYAAFTAGRYPAATARIGGADSTASQGLVTPTF
jgi:HK97 family phage major capsid protein